MEEAMVDELAEGTQAEVLFETAPSTSASSSAHLALYRRYRPDTFADVIGQEHVTEPLQRALTHNRVNHAYLFSGPRGCGKTTSARILARALNCELGPAAEPCGQCDSCRDLARGGPGSIDVIEIDAASHGGVDDARDLRERAFFAPVSSRYKIYIVDEAHMVTTAGFNALLKLVEEPPPHVKFIFATTEPDKVIGTIRSRTHHYPFRLVPPRVLSSYLAMLCQAEGIEVEPAVLPLVVRAGAGSVRDTLSVLDQLLGGAADAGVSYQQAAALLGYTPDSLLDEFLDAFAAGDAGGVFSCVDKVIEVGQDPRRFGEDLLRRLRDLVIVAAVPDALSSGLVDVSGDQAERLVTQAAALGPGELTRAAEVIALGLTDMRGTTAPRLHLELMCARVLLPGTDVDDRGIHARLDRLERRIGMTTANSPTQGEPPAPQRSAAAVEPPGNIRSAAAFPPSTGPRAAALPTSTPSSLTTAVPTEPAPPDSRSSPGAAVDPPKPQPAAVQPAAVQAAPVQPAPVRPPELSVTDVRRLWPEVLEEVKGKRRFTWILLSQNAHVAEIRNGTLVLAMPNAGARDSFGKGGSEDILREALVVVLGADLRIEAVVDQGAHSPPTPQRPDMSPERAAASWGTSPPTPPEDIRPTARPNPEPAHAAAAGTGVSSSAEAPDSPPSATAPAAAREWSTSSSVAADPALREQARHSIRPTRRGQRDESPDSDDRDAAANRDDTVLEESAESHTELLARHLGAEIIAEEEHDA
ncbi:MAG TPA: DNA polymerase III subunit gamma and tau [Propionibacteriaceae bacterium]|nr:DNA polymerase III subunit gamma and tau [Propionibacteriaceae bacterium]